MIEIDVAIPGLNTGRGMVLHGHCFSHRELEMAQVAVQFTTADLAAIDAGLRAEHASFLQRNAGALVTFGPLRHDNGSFAGYAYQTDFPGTAITPLLAFLADDPFAIAGLYHAGLLHGWKCALAARQGTLPPRAGQGFFFYGVGKPGMTARREEIVDAHRAYLMRKDAEHCVSRGPLTDAAGKLWLGSAMVYEFSDRTALDAFFADEPYCVNGLYERVDVFHWQRGGLE